MSTSPLPTKSEINEAYQRLTTETGDLYFQLEHARDTLKLLEARMEILKKQRATLNEAYQAALKAEASSGTALEPAPGS